MTLFHGHNPKAAAIRPRAWLPPRWFVVLFWHVHRALVCRSGGRFGLWSPKSDGWGAMRLTTTGRRTGQQREVVLGYFEDRDNLVTMAMNGWDAPEPAWWLNLQAQPDAMVQTKKGTRAVRAHRAVDSERARLWARWGEIDKNLNSYAARRPAETAVVVLEPRDATSRASRDTARPSPADA